MAQVKKLGRNFKTGNFDRIVAKAGGGEKGKKIAGAIFQNKARKAGK